MFDPISARFASSFSRNGISDAATETSCFGDTSMKSTLLRSARMKFPAWRQLTRSYTNLPLSSTFELACAMMYWSSSQADR
jgi:hypothetical protein